jgi:hypothetical protein
MKRSALFTLLLLIALCCPFAAYAAEDERQVTVTGVGANEEDAKRQAYRNAVQSVVGAMVVAETLVENNELVNDKILSHSDGYVTRVEQVGQTVPLQGGLVEVTMLVTVRSQQLREKLRAENISVIEVDGQSLFARAATQSEQTRDAAAIVADFLKGANLPSSLISAAADIGQAEVAESGGTATVRVPISVTVNMDAYNQFVGGLKKTLTDLGFTGETLNLGLNTRASSGTAGGRPVAAADNSARALRDLGRRLWPDNASSHIIVICEMFSLESEQSRFTFFSVPRNVFESIMEAVPPVPVDIRTELQDGNQSRITEQNVRLTMQPFNNSRNQQKADILSWRSSRGSSVDRHALLVSPGLRRNASWVNFEAFPIVCQDHSPTVTLEASFVLSSDELKAARAIQTNAVNGPVPAR